MSRCEWIPLAERARWLAALDGIEHGCTHRPEYSAAAACVTGHEAGLWHWQDEHGRAACPIGRRAAPGGGFDLVTPLGFGGFAIAGQVADLPADWTRFWQAQGALAAYVQLSPWLEPEKWRAVLAGFDADLHASRECWLWDLRPAPESLGAGLHLNHQRSLRTWQSSASPCWDPGVLWVGARDGAGSIEAVAIFLHQGRHADLFLVAATPTGREHSRGLYWLAAQRLRESGVEWLNLGGGVTDGDSLAQFKRRFGAVSRTTLALRQVLDADGFERACAAAGTDAASGSWFPPWQAG